ncbi:DUF4357 domain-containing protein [Corynebacterium sp. Marseille-P4321]|uniref:DUF4357 domain-containing protein n=1 Tax=Corynebacterium sp. Marseille-P4321 TaxID=2736603 RepID=UPI00158CCF79|nr:DUF4357 domain-containing protein [Corynebacterium sp. Marseille-P4321]
MLNDVEFTSPSAAASFLVGGSSNGRAMWHLQDAPSVTLADWEDREGDDADRQTLLPESSAQSTEGSH